MGRILPELRWESFQLALWEGTLGGLSPTGMHEHRDFESWGDLRRSIYHIIFFLYDYDHIRRQAVREGAPTVGQSMFPSPSFSGSDVAPVSEAAAGLHDAGCTMPCDLLCSPPSPRWEPRMIKTVKGS